jgi:hypothetical protein
VGRRFSTFVTLSLPGPRVTWRPFGVLGLTAARHLVCTKSHHEVNEEAAMRIETERPERPVHVSASGGSVELGIGEPSGGTWVVTALSLPQAEMVLHALGLEVAQIEERQRREVAEQAHLAQVVLDTEVHRR